MKKAFTMIELIFVIVILGILAAVALPKFLGVSQQAHEGNLKSFVGTLNRTVGPTLWSKSISDSKNGDVSYLGLEYANGDGNLTKYVDAPKELGEFNLSKCNSDVNYTIIGKANKAVAGADYFIACLNGNANQSPKFLLYKTISGTATIGDYNTTEVNGTNGEVDTYKNNEQGKLLQ